MQVTTFNRTNVQQITEEIKATLKAVEEKYGITVEVGNVKYSDGEFNSKITVRAAGRDRTDVYVEDWNRFHQLFQFAKDDNQKTFTIQGVTYQIVGIDWKQKVNKIMFKDVRTGKIYKSTPEMVRRAMGK